MFFPTLTRHPSGGESMKSSSSRAMRISMRCLAVSRCGARRFALAGGAFFFGAGAVSPSSSASPSPTSLFAKRSADLTTWTSWSLKLAPPPRSSPLFASGSSSAPPASRSATAVNRRGGRSAARAVNTHSSAATAPRRHMAAPQEAAPRRGVFEPEPRGEIGCGDAADRVSRLARRQTALSASFAAKSKVPQLSTRSNQAPSASRAHFATPAAQSQQRAQPRASSRERRRPSAARGRRVRWRDVSARSAKTSARPIRRTRDGRRLRHLPRKRRVRGAPVLRRRRPGRLDDAFLPRVPPPARRPRRRRGAMPAVPRLDLRRERRGHAARRRRRVSGLQAG
mmetsp:Transcript_32851/g.98926  ORF Transcript_32851/g.98926 Transcript_32851/m.98926 type:complete len:339 (+) Transcript_32851:465-1481(+)